MPEHRYRQNPVAVRTARDVARTYPDQVTLTLTEFLKARLDEDEASAFAEASTRPLASCDVSEASELERTFTPARVLAEVAAKRSIIGLAYEAAGLDMDKDLDRAVDAREDSGVAFVGERMLQAIALPYVDHADFREAWLA